MKCICKHIKNVIENDNIVGKSIFFTTKNVVFLECLPLSLENYDKVSQGEYFPIPFIKRHQSKLIDIVKKVIKKEELYLEYKVEYTNIENNRKYSVVYVIDSLLSTIATTNHTIESFANMLPCASNILVHHLTDLCDPLQIPLTPTGEALNYNEEYFAIHIDTFHLFEEVANITIFNTLYTKLTEDYFLVTKEYITNIFCLSEITPYDITFIENSLFPFKEIYYKEINKKIIFNKGNHFGDYTPSFITLIEDLLLTHLYPTIKKQFDKNITVDFFKGEYGIQPNIKGNFKIKFYASSSNSFQRNILQIYNSTVLPTYNVLISGAPIHNLIYSPEGVPVGSIEGQNLYCFYHISCSSNYKQQLRMFLKQAAIVINKTVSERMIYHNLCVSAWDAKTLKNFVSLLTESRLKQYKDLIGKQKQIQTQVNEASEKLINTLKEQDDNDIIMQNLKSISSVQMDNKTYNMLEILKKHPRIEKINFANNNLCIYTDLMYIEDPRTSLLHEIGKFKIELPVYSTTEILLTNLTRNGYGTGGPHIGGDKTPCLGNIHYTVTTMVGNRHYEPLIELLIQFLESVDINDEWGGERLHHYPVIRPIDKEKTYPRYYASPYIFGEDREDYDEDDYIESNLIRKYPVAPYDGDWKRFDEDNDGKVNA